ncbi:hypothetical protein POM88_043491 [Heracleum sosnowskyi]|uniref:Uncharacterized protein n=1 Tax=Heracleum sosnowskyi TaxID=360622 RepID=A0AAD8H154_9APIA|nr:hypothetical protein POM88_043491 [Heracleum sosnowskyi]
MMVTWQLCCKSLVDNRISGSIPWELTIILTLEELILEENQLGGSLPTALGSLRNLRRLRISYLRRSFSSSPNLRDMTYMKYLIPRNCLIKRFHSSIYRRERDEKFKYPRFEL